MTRRFWVLLHRYAGLYMAFFLIVAGVTGSLIAFYDELEGLINPHLHDVAPRGAALDAPTLIERAEARVPEGRVTDLILHRAPDQSAILRMEPRINPAMGEPYVLDFTELYLDPYTGRELGRRRFADLSQGLVNLMSFIYRFHYSLALDQVGTWLLGIAALIWTLDCFVGFYLTFPPRAKRYPHPPLPRRMGEGKGEDPPPLSQERGFDSPSPVRAVYERGRVGWGSALRSLTKLVRCRGAFTPSLTLPRSAQGRGSDTRPCPPADRGRGARRGAATNQRSFWSRWKPAWCIKWRRGATRINFDLHRAGGLWVWPMLLVFAWSAVQFNLPEQVYKPVMKVFFEFDDPQSHLPKLDKRLEQLALDWRKALRIGRASMAEQAARHGFAIEHEVWLWLDREHGVYHYGVHSDRDIAATSGMTRVIFDANNGALKAISLPRGQYSGDTVTNWLSALHQGEIFGLPYRIFVCVFGLIVAMLSVTGVTLWLRKRRSRWMRIDKADVVRRPSLPRAF